MTREEFHARFRGRLLLHVTEAWALRHAKPSELGSLLDEHYRQLRGMLNEIYDAFAAPTPAPAANGAARGPVSAKGG